MKDKILTALTQHSSYAHRLNTSAVNAILKEFDNLSNKSLRELRELLEDLTESERTALAAGNYTTTRLKKIKEFFNAWQKETDETLYSSFETGAISLAASESAFVAALGGEASAVVNGAVIYQAAKKVPVVGGALVSELFTGLAQTLKTNTERAIRQGITDGLSNEEIFKLIKGSSNLPDQPSVLRSAAIEIDRTVRTARNHIGNTAYQETFKDLGYTHLKVVATLDGRTCGVCASRDGDVRPIDKFGALPPWHPNSRTIVVGCDKDGVLVGRRPFVMADQSGNKKKDEIGQVNANTTYKDWFDKDATEDFKRNWLGKTKYELYKNGGYSLDRFVDPLNRELTIAELRELDKKTFEELGL